MEALLFILLLAICPLAMALMMRGGHGHGGHRARGGPADSPDAEARIRSLEAEVLRLRSGSEADSARSVTATHAEGARLPEPAHGNHASGHR